MTAPHAGQAAKKIASSPPKRAASAWATRAGPRAGRPLAGAHTITAADPLPPTSATPSTASTATLVRTDQKIAHAVGA
jgi:hypothetical protein